MKLLSLHGEHDAQHVEHELVHVLARKVAIGRRSEDDLFAEIDDRQEISRLPV